MAMAGMSHMKPMPLRRPRHVNRIVDADLRIGKA
jgi:hypothetical protein